MTLNSDGTPMFDLKPYTLSAEERGVKAKLIDKFIVPPFSVLDTRQGYWQDRKRLWTELGLKSELGRDQTLTYGKTEGNFTSEIIGERGGGISIFDPVLCELLYRWFCPEGGTVLDPFAGGSVRGVVAQVLGRKYTGIDLSKSQIEENINQAKSIIPDNMPEWLVGNSENVNELLPKGKSYDMIIGCPPYHDLEKYTDDKEDLSNVTWTSFKEKYADIIKKCVQKLEWNRFACFVVSEIRQDDGYYKGFVPYTIKSFVDAGMEFYNEMILVNSVGSLSVRITRQFNSGRKIGRVHQNILVFYSGDHKNIQKHFKELNFTGA